MRQELRNKKLGYKFRRQHIIDVFIADFICIEKKLIIEVDGDYHNIPNQQELDILRTQNIKMKLAFMCLFDNEA
ncbi:endonuclease domain-containing protein [Flavobacterium sp.]|uniref:endonuclease domain-containing protein n=1 Tax=Flavobacterium sp. TaxID=239 RepID=UPI0035283BB4